MTNEPKRRRRRIVNYPARLNVLIPNETEAAIERLADEADWPTSEVVRQALEAGLPEVARKLKEDG